MGIATLYSGTGTISTTEYSLTLGTTGLATKSDVGVFRLSLDVSAMVAGDQFLISVYEKARSGDTQRLCYTQTLVGVQPQIMFVSPSLALMYGWDFTVTKIAGTDRAFYWSIASINANTTSIETVNSLPGLGTIGRQVTMGGVVYTDRMVAQFSSTSDFLNLTTFVTDIDGADFDISHLVRESNLTQNYNSRYMKYFINSTSDYRMCMQETASEFLQLVWGVDGSTPKYECLSAIRCYNVFRKVRITKVSGVLTLYIDGVSIGSSNVSAISGNTVSSIRFGEDATDNTDILPFQIANISHSLNGTPVDYYACDGAAGTTNVVNSVTAGRPGTLTNSASHVEAWVPTL